MKYLAILLLLTLSAELHAQGGDGNTLVELAGRESLRYEHLRQQAPSGHADDYDVLHHEISWSIDPAQRFIAGYVKTRFRALVFGFCGNIL